MINNIGLVSKETRGSQIAGVTDFDKVTLRP